MISFLPTKSFPTTGVSTNSVLGIKPPVNNILDVIINLFIIKSIKDFINPGLPFPPEVYTCLLRGAKIVADERFRNSKGIWEANERPTFIGTKEYTVPAKKAGTTILDQ
jgi:hypothetical protein